MIYNTTLKPEDFNQRFSDDEKRLEWLKNRLYPDGISCPVCKKVTKHHKIAKRPCYSCDYCGHQIYPTSGTIFYKSSIPLKVWFEIILKISRTKERISVREIQKEYRISYQTAWKMVNKIKKFIQESNTTTRNKKNNPDSFSEDDEVEYSKHFYSKRDRTARLLRILILLSQYQEGLRVEQISAKCSISKRTAYRDLEALESELGIPIWEEGNLRGINKGYFLPPIHFTLSEASIVFMAARLMQNFACLTHPTIASTFMKLNSILPSHLQKQTQNILDHIEMLPAHEDKTNRFNILLQAWISQHSVSIYYQYHNEDKPQKLLIDPYFMETSIIGNSIYLIAFCHQKNELEAFKLESIVGDVTLEPHVFKIPVDFDPVEHLEVAWGIHFDDVIKTVKLHCQPNLSKLMVETYLHSSQVIEPQDDNTIIMTLKVRDSIHFCKWVLGWGDQIEVLEPSELRQQIKDMARSVVKIYPD